MDRIGLGRQFELDKVGLDKVELDRWVELVLRQFEVDRIGLDRWMELVL